VPYQSKSQVRMMFAKAAAGEVKKGTAERWAHETPDMKHLPDKVPAIRKHKVNRR